MAELWNNLLDLLFPPRPECPFCGAPEVKGEICKTCLALLRAYRLLLHCRLCGRLFAPAVPLARGSARLCDECQMQEWPFTLARALGPYEGILKEAVHRFKYEGFRQLAKPLAALMAEQILTEELWSVADMDLLLPVPLTYNRMRRRGFNQSALLAKELGSRLKIPVRERILVKVTDTPAQAGLSKAERGENLKDSFRVADKQALRGKTVLLIDDVFTTGNTVSYIAAVMRQAGVGQVFVLTVATGHCS